jgi:hypothetical protein
MGLSIQSNAQQRWFRTSSLEFGLIGGFSHYSGDLTKKYFETQGFKPSVGLITRYTPGRLVTVRLSAQYGSIEGDDKWHEDQDNDNRRNLNFKSDLWDFTGAAEFNFNSLDTRDKTGVIPYALIGVSVFKYNPKAQFIYDAGGPMDTYLGRDPDGNRIYAQLEERDEEWVELQPLGTEGQETTEFNDRKRYALTQVAIPIGGGFKFKLSHKWTLGIEYGTRITFTDYLDDVSSTYVDPIRLNSQYGPMSAAMADRSPTLRPEEDLNGNAVPRGNPDKRDLYGIFGVTFTYRLYGNRTICPTF